MHRTPIYIVATAGVLILAYYSIHSIFDFDRDDSDCDKRNKCD